MKLAIMQPYFFPYVGYYQLIGAADLFVLYDNIKYTKKGWINRNRMLRNGVETTFSLSLKSASDSLDIRDRELSPDFNREKFLNQIAEAYRRAPYFTETYALIEQVVGYQESNLYKFLYHSLINTCGHLGLATPIRISSEIDIDHELKGQDKVLALCAALGADTYINAIGGTQLYNQEEFQARGVELLFVKSRPFTYPQFDNNFVPWLSIIDVMMFNPKREIFLEITGNFDLV
ncbi:MAG TPA: WbqC family protein [Burkholderiaceae bacterium]|nr:WbqC family protein [Burkholderiaceae bacterium]